ncbi:hypothetical protein [Pseudomonas sp. St290]|uniref:hypothetical protein n=1 Tax=Pseudomonas sp. St290 TaxID=1602166 RepID=UPI001BB34A5D|nr:hypothetical protein [Pseudomonas sp. St290]
MFEKYPDQAKERRHTLLAGSGTIVVGALFFLAGGKLISLAFLLPGLAFVLVAIFCSHAGFETAKRIGKFFEWFA